MDTALIGGERILSGVTVIVIAFFFVAALFGLVGDKVFTLKDSEKIDESDKPYILIILFVTGLLLPFFWKEAKHIYSSNAYAKNAAEGNLLSFLIW